MADFHYGHANAGKTQHVALSFFKDRNWQDCRSGAEIENAVGHNFWSFVLITQRSVVFGLGFLPFGFRKQSTDHRHYSNRPRKAFPAIFNTTDLGKNRSANTVKRFGQPETITLFFRFKPRMAVSTTSSGVCDPRIGGRSILAASKKFVSVTPGHRAITWIPKALFSSESASENERTNALFAAYVAIKGTG